MYNNITGIPTNFITIIDKLIASKLQCLNISCANPNTRTYIQDTEPASPTEGDSWYNTDTNTYYVYDGTDWQPVGASGRNEECCPSENGITLDEGVYKLGGSLTEDTAIDSTTYDLDISTEDATAPGETTISRIFTGDKSYTIGLITQSGNDVAVVKRDDVGNPLDFKALSVGDTSVSLISTPDITSTMVQVYASDAEGVVAYIDQGTSANNAFVKAMSGEVQLEASSVQIRSTELTTDETTVFNFIPDTLTTLNIGADTTAVNIGKTGAKTTAKGLLTVDTGLTVSGKIKVVTLPTYADNAAAGALSIGDLYIANGSGVNIQGTLMVKY